MCYMFKMYLCYLFTNLHKVSTLIWLLFVYQCNLTHVYTLIMLIVKKKRFSRLFLKNLSKPNTPLNRTFYSVPRVFGLEKFHCIYICVCVCVCITNVSNKHLVYSFWTLFICSVCLFLDPFICLFVYNID